jgi:hypothetical protein
LYSFGAYSSTCESQKFSIPIFQLLDGRFGRSFRIW